MLGVLGSMVAEVHQLNKEDQDIMLDKDKPPSMDKDTEDTQAAAQSTTPATASQRSQRIIPPTLDLCPDHHHQLPTSSKATMHHHLVQSPTPSHRLFNTLTASTPHHLSNTRKPHRTGKPHRRSRGSEGIHTPSLPQALRALNLHLHAAAIQHHPAAPRAMLISAAAIRSRL